MLGLAPDAEVLRLKAALRTLIDAHEPTTGAKWWACPQAALDAATREVDA